LTINAQFPSSCQILWNYIATRHGKGEVNRIGALLKRELCKEQIKPQGFKTQNAKKIINLLQFEANKFHAAHPNARKILNKTF
jgi:endonuclease III